MKTSIFDMTFTLPPLVEITEVEKDMLSCCPVAATAWPARPGRCHPGPVVRRAT